ncbi:trypsin-like peptidase domain-containing protein [Actinomadura kijaniata]|uniref:S1C family serine protease n=1 Tax=Actinomadura kijaniata TaxID=46161 RepID=UPI003F1ABF19
MTEQNRGRNAAEQDDAAPGFEAEPERSPTGPQATLVDQEMPVTGETPADPATAGDEPADGPEAGDGRPEAGGTRDDLPGSDGPRDGVPGDRLVAGFAPPDAPGEPVRLDKPAEVPAAEHWTPAPQAPAQGGPGPERPQRPGFVPHHQDPHAPQGGWPHQQPPPPGAPRPMGPPPGAPMGPPGAMPPGMNQQPPGAPQAPGATQPPGGFGQPPNWAPVPPPPSGSRGGPGLGMLAVIALIVALVAGGVGAGVGVTVAGDDSGPVNLGSPSSGGGAVKNRPPDSVAGVAQRVLPSVVMIRVKGATGEGAGTGFIVQGGYIVTNNHVVAPAAQGGGEIEVVFNDKKTLPATIKGRDPGSDIAVVKAEGNHSLPPLPLGDSDELAVGDPVIAIGSPLGLQGSVTTGIVSSLNRAVPTRGESGGDASVLNAIQTDAAINPGNSGGPLVDARGRVIGINTAIATLGGQGVDGGEAPSGSIGLGFAIPINHGRRVAQEIINTGRARRAQIGIGINTTYPGPGVKISDRETGGVPPIVKGGPADKAGLKPGDVITKLGDRPVEDPADLSAQIRSRAPGDKLKVTYIRDGKETTVEVTLAAAN